MMHEQAIPKGRGARLHTALPTIHEQREFWDDHWQRWQERKTLNEWARRRGTRILQIVRGLNLNNPRVLDLGCGFGWFTEDLAKFGPATGVDLSEEAIAMAKQRRPDIEFLAGNVLEDVLPKKHFDVAVSQEVLAHVEDQPKFLAQAASVLKPGGYFIITTANRYVWRRMAIDPNLPPQHIELFVSMKQLKELMRPHFDIVQATSILPQGNTGILRITNSPKLNRLLAAMFSQKRVDRWKEQMGLGYSLLVVGRKRS